MEPNNIDPVTLKAVKKLAKRIKRVHCVRHFQALDMAAQHFGYADYRDLNNRITGKAGADGDRKRGPNLYVVTEIYTGAILDFSVTPAKQC